MNLPKFIITLDGVLRLGMVNQHKHLLKPGDQCIGGGYYHFDFVSNRILLDRESYDFGRPKWHLLETLKVPSTSERWLMPFWVNASGISATADDGWPSNWS